MHFNINNPICLHVSWIERLAIFLGPIYTFINILSTNEQQRDNNNIISLERKIAFGTFSLEILKNMLLMIKPFVNLCITVFFSH